MTNKEKIIDYMTKNNSVNINVMNLAGVNYKWRDPMYAIAGTFSLPEIVIMPDNEVNNLMKLAENITKML